MRNKEVEYLIGNNGLSVYDSEVFSLIENEPNLLPKSIEKIRIEIVNGLCVLALLCGEIVGYVSIIPYHGMKYAKISSHVVEFNHRGCWIGSELAKQIYCLAKKLYPECKVITVVGPENVRKFERLGMVRINKHNVPKEFIDTTSINLNIDTPNKIILIEP